MRKIILLFLLLCTGLLNAQISLSEIQDTVGKGYVPITDYDPALATYIQKYMLLQDYLEDSISWASVPVGLHDAVTLAGSYDYITLSGQVITRNQIDLTTDVTGLLPYASLSGAPTLLSQFTDDLGHVEESTTVTDLANGLDISLSTYDITVSPDFVELATETTIDNTDYVIIHDATTPNDGKITYANLLADIVSDASLDLEQVLTNGNDAGGLEALNFSEVEADEFIGDLRGAVLFKAQAGEALAKGDVVYVSGISGNTTIVSKADADDSAKMPAFGVVAAAASSPNPVDIYTFGTLSNLNTSGYTLGDILYVSTTAGQLTATPPTGESALLQNIAKVTRVHASSGSIKISGAGRTNATPNLNTGRLFVGNASNQAVADGTVYVDIANSRVGIGTLSPIGNLTVKAENRVITIGDSGRNNYAMMKATNTAGTGAAYMIQDAYAILYEQSGTLAYYMKPLHGGFSVYDTDGFTENIRLSATADSYILNDNFGIGTPSPQHIVHISAPNSSPPKLMFNNTESSQGSGGDLGGILWFNDDQSGIASSVGSGNIVASAIKTTVINPSGNQTRLGLFSGSTAPNTSFGDPENYADNTIERLSVLWTGEVGINNISPSATLDVVGTSEFSDDMNVDSGTLFVDASANRVGIGTSSPLRKMHIVEGNANLEFRQLSSGAELKMYGADDTNSAIIFGDATDKAEAAIYYVASQKRVSFNGYNNSHAFSIDQNLNIGIGETSPSATLDVNGDVEIATVNTDNTTDDVLVHSSDGTVSKRTIDNLIEDAGYWDRSAGILTPSNANDVLKIETAGGVDGFASQLLINGNTSGGSPALASKIELRSNSDFRGRGIKYTNTTDAETWFSGVPYTGAGYSIGFDATTNQSEYDANSLLYIQEGGNVGIGLTNPSQKLEVAGNIFTTTTGDKALRAYFGSEYTEVRGYGVQSDRSVMYIRHTVANTGDLEFGFNGRNWDDIRAFVNTSFAIRNDATTLVHVNATNGNVGIGTSSPNVKLEISKDAPILRLNDTDTALSDDEVSSKIEFYQNDLSGAGVSSYFMADGAGSTGGQTMKYFSGNHLFSTGVVSGTNVENALYIHYSGNVGIGTTNPSNKLHVLDGSNEARFGNITGVNYIQGLFKSSASSGGIRLENSTGYQWEVQSLAGQDKFIIYDRTAAAFRLVIDNSGNVGIGTSSPSSIFNVEYDDFGGGDGLTFKNTNTASSANAVVAIINGGTTGGDPITRYNLVGEGSWYFGADNDNSNVLYANWNSLGVNELELDNAGNLTVEGDVFLQDVLRIGGTGVSNNMTLSVIGFTNILSSNNYPFKIDLTTASEDFIIETGGTSNIEALRIDGATGYIGIHQNTPSAELDVVGDTELNGEVTWSERALGEMYRLAEQSVTNGNTNKIDFATQVYQDGDITTDVTTNDRITVTNAGKYTIHLSALMSNDGTGSDSGRLLIYKNGTQIADSEFSNVQHVGLASVTKSISGILNLSASDYLEVYLQELSGTGDAEVARVRFTVKREIGY